MNPTRRRFLAGSAGAGVLAGLSGVADPWSAQAAPGTAQSDDDDVFYHTGFEDSSDTSWLDDPTSYDATVAFAGQQSLKYVRTDSTTYHLVQHEVPFEPGEPLELTAFIKTTAINPNPYYGAAMALEAFDSDGVWIKGAYAAGVVSVDEWEYRSVVFEEIPADAHSMTITLYISRNQAGTAWYDEVTVRRPQPKLLSGNLVYPSYRGQIIPGERETLELQAGVSVADAPSGAQTWFVLEDSAGSVVDQQQQVLSEVATYSYLTTGMSPGSYSVRAELREADGSTVLEANEWSIEKLTQAPLNYIDEHGRFIRDGEVFFPMGFYTSALSPVEVNGTIEDALADLQNTPFNTLLSYRPPVQSELDDAHAHGVSVIFSLAAFYYDESGGYYRPPDLVTEEDEVPVIKRTVNEFRDHPALLAWYTSDELNVDHFGPRMIAHHEAIAATDADHPTFSVAPWFRPGEVYQRSADVVGVDNYPVYGKPDDELGAPGAYAAEAAANVPGRGFWHVPQYFNWDYYNRDGRFPTYDELRSMCWQYMVNGATGLVIYQLPLMHRDPDHEFSDLMAVASNIANEIFDRLPIMLSVDTPGEVTSGGADGVAWTTRRHDGSDYVAAVSSTKAAQAIVFVSASASSVDVVGEDRTLAVDPDGRFADDIDPLAVRLYRIVEPTYESVRVETVTAFADVAGPGYQGVTRAATQALRNAERAARTGDAVAVDSALTEYRTLLSEHTGARLEEDMQQRLTRLSYALSN